jgi:IS30 family transposase
MGKSYTHVTQEERCQIYTYKKAGFSKIRIAAMLSRHVSTIKLEIGRNKGQKGYRPQ